MIQGGGFDRQMTERQTRAPITNEADNGLKNNLGTIAMARTSDPHSATAQFFINVANNDSLNFRARTQDDWGYAVFGKVTQGMDVVMRIAKSQTGEVNGMTDVPLQPVVIIKATIKN